MKKAGPPGALLIRARWLNACTFNLLPFTESIVAASESILPSSLLMSLHTTPTS
jgi:hypothetical protein